LTANIYAKQSVTGWGSAGGEMSTLYSKIAYALSKVLNISSVKVIKKIRSGQSAESIVSNFTSLVTQKTLFEDKQVSSTADVIKIASIEISKIEKLGYRVSSIWDSDYPQKLKEIYDPPILIYYYGDISMANEKVIAVIGTRSCTSYGKKIATEISHDLSKIGIVIASGMAQGIDRFAHYGAITSSGKTIAVLGSGIDVIYPSSNRELYNLIKEGGLLISEHPLGYPPLKQNFPLRNRIISGISDGVIIIEAPKRSGSLITAALALDQGRHVLAVPGNVNSRKSYGTNMLIRSGASLISCWQEAMEDIYGIYSLEENYPSDKCDGFITVAKEKDKIIEKVRSVLAAQPLTVEQIVSELEINYTDAIFTVVNMEMMGIVRRRSDMVYELI